MPIQHEHANEAEEYRMQLRDQFAMAALTGLLSSGVIDKSVTRFAYQLADEMLEARNK